MALTSMRAEWRFVSMMPGERCVMTSGAMWMQGLSAGSWAMVQVVRRS